MNEKVLKKLFSLSEKSFVENEFPVSAIIYDETGIISCGYNKRNRTRKTTDHAEIVAIEKANKKLGEWNLQNKCMVVTLEPCDMCKAVIREARLNKVYYIVPRYKFKKPYKCTSFENLKIDGQLSEQYRENISHFFDNKR